jgi:hypothetical protein
LCSVTFCTVDATDRDGLELRDRRQLAGAADLNIDTLDDCRCLLGREFMRDRPARTARNEPEPLLPIEPVHFIDDAVDVVGQFRARFLDLAIVLEQLVHAPALLHERIGRQPPALHRGDGFRLRISGQFARLAPGVSKEFQGPRCSHLRIDLPQRTGRGVARVHVKRLAFFLLPLVQRDEVVFRHVDFAARLEDIRGVFALQLMRDVFDGANIRGDVLAFRAVATRRGDNEFSLLIAQRTGKPVDLGLRGNDQFVFVREPQKAPDAIDEIRYILVREGVAER